MFCTRRRMHPIGTRRLVFSCIQRQQDVYRPFPLISLNSMWQSRHKWHYVTHCTINCSVTSGWYHAVFAVTFDIIYSLSCLWRKNFIQVMGQKYKNCYFRLKCYFCKCAEIKSWHIYVWSQHLCKRLDSSCDVLRPKRIFRRRLHHVPSNRFQRTRRTRTACSLETVC